MEEINIGVNLTRRCNMKCHFCYYTTLNYSSGNTNKTTEEFDLPLMYSNQKYEVLIILTGCS